MEAEQEAEAQRQAEMEAEQEAEAQRQAEMEAEQLRSDVEAKNKELNEEFKRKMDERDAAFDSTINANSVEDRERFAEAQRNIGEEMNEIRSRIIENNNRLN